jgi:hypothetical protein
MGKNSWPADVWEQYHAHMRSELYGPAMAGGVFAGDPPDLWERDAAMHLAGRFLGIAKETKCLNETDWERLNEMRLELDGYRREGLTPKNIALIRQVLTPGIWGRVVNLPFAMMAEAQRQQHDPIRAAVTAQLGVAIAILSVAPWLSDVWIIVHRLGTSTKLGHREYWPSSFIRT